MSHRREVWMVSLDPIRGSEQAGTRPALILQNDSINRFTTTVIAIPLTTNLSRADLPSALLIPQGEAAFLQIRSYCVIRRERSIKSGLSAG
jgi:mRNA interferase MazF